MREGVNPIQVDIEVLEGQLGRSVAVRAFTMNASAIGKCTTKHCGIILGGVIIRVGYEKLYGPMRWMY